MTTSCCSFNSAAPRWHCSSRSRRHSSSATVCPIFSLSATSCPRGTWVVRKTGRMFPPLLPTRGAPGSALIRSSRAASGAGRRAEDETLFDDSSSSVAPHSRRCEGDTEETLPADTGRPATRRASALRAGEPQKSTRRGRFDEDIKTTLSQFLMQCCQEKRTRKGHPH